MKTIKIKFDIRRSAANIFGVLMARFSVILLGIFFLSIAAWAFIFWYYGIRISRAESNVEIKIVRVKEGDLKKILNGINTREAAQKAILDKSIPNPFIKPAEAQ